MSFNKIVEAEIEAENTVISAKERAKQMVAEVLSKQTNVVEGAKIQGQKKFEADLADFETSLKTRIETENKKNKDNISSFEQTILKRKDIVVKQILSHFK